MISSNKSVIFWLLCLHEDGEPSVMCSVKDDSVSAEVDDAQSCLKPVVVEETLDVARYILPLVRGNII